MQTPVPASPSGQPIDADSPDTLRMSVAEATSLGRRALARLGYPEDEASIIVDQLIDNALGGYKFAGLPRILAIAGDAKTRNARSPVRVVHETPISALLDGGNNVGYIAAYRGAGVAPPKDEAPDHLPVVLEFAATVDPDAGRRLLTEYRVSIEVLRTALADASSMYEPAVAAVCATLGAPTDDHIRRAQRLAKTGPPAEAVGLQPFTLTVPPRREAR